MKRIFTFKFAFEQILELEICIRQMRIFANFVTSLFTSQLVYHPNI